MVEATNLSQFIAYHVNSDGEQSSPIAVGDSEESCRADAYAHIMIIGCPEGILSIQERPDVPAKSFEMLRDVIETYFARPQGSA
ncbi:MAG TPA: hypothetical protein VIG47_03100 [Gemmatimonadaceae bacterium]|jgi:hypothetical protein